MNRTTSGLLTACLASLPLAGFSATETDQRNPTSAMVVDVTQPPYLAKGDGVADDSDALQRALNENVGRHRAIFLPKGTYLVSRTLTWPKKWDGHDNWGMTMVRGENRDLTVLRLRDGTFTNAAQTRAIMACGGFGSADWFHNYVENLTFEVGARNPGGIGLQFYANNSGAVRDCRFVAQDGSGGVGLDLGHHDMNGPLLVRHCEVIGFDRGISTAGAVNSQTFEFLNLRGQRQFGFDNAGQVISLRHFTSDNAVPALRTYGTVCLMDSRLTGRAGAADLPAVINYNGGSLGVRDLATPGYRRAVADLATPDFAQAYRLGKTDPAAGAVNAIGEDYFPTITSPLAPRRAVPAAPLEVRETPETHWEPPAQWANVDTFGADPGGVGDSADAVQRAVDSGAATIFFPGSYRWSRPIRLRGAVRRLVGLGGMINYGGSLRPDFQRGDGATSSVALEHFDNINGGLEVDTPRTVILRSVSDCPLRFTPRAEGGELFLEDVVTHDLRLKRQTVWARQLNIEIEGPHLRNDAGWFWVLGYKTERGDTLLETVAGGRSEVWGGFSYTTTAGKLAPMFINDHAAVHAYFTEVCFSGDPFATLVREIDDAGLRIIRRGAGRTTPYSAELTTPSARGADGKR